MNTRFLLPRYGLLLDLWHHHLLQSKAIGSVQDLLYFHKQGSRRGAVAICRMVCRIKVFVNVSISIKVFSGSPSGGSLDLRCQVTDSSGRDLLFILLPKWQCLTALFYLILHINFCVFILPPKARVSHLYWPPFTPPNGGRGPDVGYWAMHTRLGQAELDRPVWLLPKGPCPPCSPVLQQLIGSGSLVYSDHQFVCLVVF